MTHEPARPESGRKISLLSAALLIAVLLLIGTASAGEVSVPVPADSLIAGETATLPVILHGADGIDGYQITVSELSGGTARINTEADCIAGTRFAADNTKAILLSTTTPLNGDVTLFHVDVTPVSGKNAILSIEVVEIMKGDDSVVTQYPGKDTIIPVTNGVTEYIKESPNSETTAETVMSASAIPLYAERTVQDTANPQSSRQSLPAASTPAPAKAEKSPGFLPLTLILAGAAAGYLALRRRP